MQVMGRLQHQRTGSTAQSKYHGQGEQIISDHVSPSPALEEAFLLRHESPFSHPL